VRPFDLALKKMRAICLALPDTKETPTWGEPHFRVGEKIFAGLGEKKGVVTIGFKLELDHADAMVRRPGFARAPYVGHKGWVSMDVTGATDWDEARALIEQSYRLSPRRRRWRNGWAKHRRSPGERLRARGPSERLVRLTQGPPAAGG
jgi:predicted DNA-binding protein (MmcQ/YjbR family)